MDDRLEISFLSNKMYINSGMFDLPSSILDEEEEKKHIQPTVRISCRSASHFHAWWRPSFLRAAFLFPSCMHSREAFSIWPAGFSCALVDVVPFKTSFQSSFIWAALRLKAISKENSTIWQTLQFAHSSVWFWGLFRGCVSRVADLSIALALKVFFFLFFKQVSWDMIFFLGRDHVYIEVESVVESTV